MIVTRPRAEAGPTCAALRRLGFAPILSPSLRPTRRERATPSDLEGLRALIFTSPTAVRAAVADLGDAVFGVEAWTVGGATAARARQSGFSPVLCADGDAAALLARARDWRRSDDGALLHYRGLDAATDLVAALRADGANTRARVLYAAEKTGPSAAARRALSGGVAGAALFFSARAFEAFSRPFGARDLAKTTAVCMSRRIAAAAPPGRWRRLVVAKQPRLDFVLEALVDATSRED